jgi:hypothetical protein
MGAGRRVENIQMITGVNRRPESGIGTSQSLPVVSGTEKEDSFEVALNIN